MKKVLKKLYSWIPFKKQIYTVLKFIWKPKESVYKHLHFKDKFTINIDPSRGFKIYNSTSIENEIFWEGLTGNWEKESLKLWLKLCQDANTIIDLGSNTGVYALVAKTVNPNARIIAFEPHPYFYKILNKNIRINAFEIEAYEMAVSNFDGSLPIEDYSGKTKSITVESTKLDSFIEKNAIQKIDLMKIDVETHEPMVMQGFIKYFPIFQPSLLIEILNQNVADLIFDAVKPYGYLYFNINELGGIRQTAKIEKSDYYNYLLCKREIALQLGLLE